MHNPQHTPARRPQTLLAGLVVAACAALPISASAWTQFYPDSKIQVQDQNGTYHNYSAGTTSITYGDVRYTNSGGVESYKVVGTAQKRVERRYYDDYGSTTSRRWEANVLFTSPTSGVTIHQIFNGNTGPHVLVTGESSSSGSVKVYNLTSSSTTIATGVYGVTFKLESKNRKTGTIEMLVNGSLKLTGSRRSGTYYTKYGLYNPGAAQTIKFTNVKMYYE